MGHGIEKINPRMNLGQDGAVLPRDPKHGADSEARSFHALLMVDQGIPDRVDTPSK
jgi:hypothetical protein